MATAHEVAPQPSPPSSIRSYSDLDGLGGDDDQSAPAKREDSHIVDSEYSRKAKLLISLANDLMRLGGQQFDLDIPCLAFIGNQSAGKSSVVEAATGIGVPRESGTCTRCPMKCTMMRSSGVWSCEISLQFAYDKKGRDKSPPTTVFFQKVSRPQDVEIWLKRAQAAILSPNVDSDQFRDMTVEQLKGLKTLPFSYNTIELLVRDPEGTDLCFVDLPGIIQHHTKDVTLVPLVKDLVERHITRENTIIVVTIPMTDDLENQEAFLIASRADPSGLRTIGVGTKPDLLSEGSLSALQTWKDILGGTESSLKHGYYCVKMPDDLQRRQGLKRSELTKLEADFFKKTAPWKTLRDQSRLGMPNFVESTSQLLIGLIETNIPVIKDTVNDLLVSEKKELEKLPPAPVVNSPLSSMTMRIILFSKALQGTIDGNMNKDFVHRNRERYDRFKTEILNTAPDLRNQNGTVAAPVAPGTVGPLTLDNVREVIKNHLTWELPGYVPFDATKDLILRHIQHWKTPLKDCFDDICESTLSLITRLVDDDEHFGRFSDLKAFAKTIIEEEGILLLKKIGQKLTEMFELEHSAPVYTANDTVYTQEKQAWLYNIYCNNQANCSDEHKVMADVHAYFKVASARFIDHVVNCLEGEWHKKLVQRLEEKLIENIPLLSQDRLASMFREHPSIRHKRENFTRNIDQLTKIKMRLLEYEEEASTGLDD